MTLKYQMEEYSNLNHRSHTLDIFLMKIGHSYETGIVASDERERNGTDAETHFLTAD